MEVLMFAVYALIVAVIAAPVTVAIGAALIDYWFKKSAEVQADRWKKLADAAKTMLEKAGHEADG